MLAMHRPCCNRREAPWPCIQRQLAIAFRQEAGEAGTAPPTASQRAFPALNSAKKKRATNSKKNPAAPTASIAMPAKGQDTNLLPCIGIRICIGRSRLCWCAQTAGRPDALAPNRGTRPLVMCTRDQCAMSRLNPKPCLHAISPKPRTKNAEDMSLPARMKCTPQHTHTHTPAHALARARLVSGQ